MTVHTPFRKLTAESLVATFVAARIFAPIAFSLAGLLAENDSDPTTITGETTMKIYTTKGQLGDEIEVDFRIEMKDGELLPALFVASAAGVMVRGLGVTVAGPLDHSDVNELCIALRAAAAVCARIRSGDTLNELE